MRRYLIPVSFNRDRLEILLPIFFGSIKMTMIKKRKRERKKNSIDQKGWNREYIAEGLERLSVGKINDGCTECVIHVTGESWGEWKWMIRTFDVSFYRSLLHSKPYQDRCFLSTFMYNVSPFRGFFFNRDIPIYLTTSSDSFPIPDEIIIRFTGGESLIRLFQIKYNNTYNRLYRSNIN